MDHDKSILEKIGDTMKDIANIASEAASQALQAERPPLKAGERAVAYMPLATDGLVADPMMVAPIAAFPVRKRKRRVAKRTAAKARKAAKRPATKKSKKAVKKTVKKTATRTKAPKKAAKKKKRMSGKR